MTQVTPLLAKSYPKPAQGGGAPPAYALLAQHSQDVAAACRALADAAGPAVLRAADLAAEEPRFRRILLLSGWLQDLGKANDLFQEMLRSPGTSQMLRHEVLSALLIWSDEQGLGTWLAPLGPDLQLALFAAAGHHRKFDEDTPVEGTLGITVHLPDLRPILVELQESVNQLLQAQGATTQLGAPPARLRPWQLDQLTALGLLAQLRDDFDVWARRSLQDPREQRLLGLIKAFGIAADVCASAVARRGSQFIPTFIANELASRLTPTDLQQIINEWAWNQVEPSERPEDKALRRGTLPPGFEVRLFQQAIAESTGTLTLAMAGCGAGKSRAAYEWAKARARDGLRLVFCLPTTGTTTEHYRDYALLSGIPAELSHSRAAVDLRNMAGSDELDEIAETVPSEEADEGSGPQRAAEQALRATRDKLEALGLWRERFVVTTTDTVLGIMANARRSLCAAPTLLQSAIVFDEIHAFDEALFNHLLVFLKHFPHLQVLLMTASLPTSRLAALRALRPDLVAIPGPPEPETAARYEISVSDSDEALWARVSECVARKGRILWVRNQVEWANEIFRACRERFPDAQVDVYHSRLCYAHRSRRHRDVIDRFQSKSREQALILVATQVAEMSLNLSADLLVTDLAPVPALIQRMGRLNRVALPTEPKPALVVPLPTTAGGQLPYQKNDLEQARLWLDRLRALARPLTQRDLSEHFAADGHGQEWNPKHIERDSGFISGLWRTRPGKTRGDGTTVTVLLEQHLARVGAHPRADALREWEVSIPFRAQVLRWPKVGGLHVAPHDAVGYDFQEDTREGTGASWL